MGKLKLLQFFVFMGLLSFLFGCTKGAKDQLLFENSNFETGTLLNWNASGDAFSNQPVWGDNSALRNNPAEPQGNYWIGTFENRSGQVGNDGDMQGDAPTGVLESIPFVIKGKKISFLLGAGNGTGMTVVGLQIDGQVVHSSTGTGNLTGEEKMQSVVWDVSEFRGKEAKVMIIDLATGAWGHINADNFHYTK